jgi:peptidoglycan/xylan/chitin deacetylase (PgdA/CDA1 family)
MATVQRSGTYHYSRRAFLKWFEHHLEGSHFGKDVRMRRALEKALRPGRKASLREVAASTLAGSVVRSGKTALRRLRPLIAAGPTILMYHRVAAESFDPWSLAVSPENFSDQLGWIARNRTVLPLTELVELHRQGRLPRNAVALTFDDGYACFSETAVPLLKQFQIPATVFLPSELIRGGREFWWDELERIVMGHEERVIRLGSQEIDLGERRPNDNQWLPDDPPKTPRQQAYHQLWSRLYALTPADLELGMRELREQAAVEEARRASHRPLRPEEVRAVRSDLVEFGSHALTHPSLPLLGPKQKAREITESIERCAELTGSEPRCFAYPFGDSDPQSEELVEQAGFLCACRADGDFVRRKSSRFALPRMLVGNWDSAGLARRLGRP